MLDELKKIKMYLLTLTRPVGMSDKVYNTFQKFARKFLVYEGLLFFGNEINIPSRRVVWEKVQQDEIIREMHNEGGHWGKNGTYTKVALHYWLKGLYQDVHK